MSPNIDAKSILEGIGNRAEQVENSLKELDKDLDIVNDEEEIKNVAFASALEDVKSRIPDIITYTVLNACISSNEYNYDLYINHLLRAINSNINNLVSIQGSPNVNETSFRVDFSSLGEIDEWASAVEAVRDAMGWGLTPPKTASKMWREKIYRVDREGGTVPKTVKYKTKKGIEKTKEVYVTEKFIGKYRETIQLRLNAISPNHAPFWYIIEHGNYNLGFGEGTPYPTVRGTGFIKDIELLLKTILITAYNSYISKATEFVKDYFDDFKQFLGGKQENLNVDLVRLEERLSRTIAKEAPMLTGETRVEQVVELTRSISYVRRGRRYTQLQYIKTGRFV